ncbi:hypothetical protein B0H16DRAFT_1808178 [Mycena metata]|uniref:Uncharacterized protein n=1 Tax=Mycena metata TaxID=1033252 RepID=A0AAD7H7G4_9AGAR|nr:hypothetical protein B0H16DRAFT_1808178 [Mycena metata]
MQRRVAAFTFTAPLFYFKEPALDFIPVMVLFALTQPKPGRNLDQRDSRRITWIRTWTWGVGRNRTGSGWEENGRERRMEGKKGQWREQESALNRRNKMGANPARAGAQGAAASRGLERVSAHGINSTSLDWAVRGCGVVRNEGGGNEERGCVGATRRARCITKGRLDEENEQVNNMQVAAMRMRPPGRGTAEGERFTGVLACASFRIPLEGGGASSALVKRCEQESEEKEGRSIAACVITGCPEPTGPAYSSESSLSLSLPSSSSTLSCPEDAAGRALALGVSACERSGRRASGRVLYKSRGGRDERRGEEAAHSKEVKEVLEGKGRSIEHIVPQCTERNESHCQKNSTESSMEHTHATPAAHPGTLKVGGRDCMRKETSWGRASSNATVSRRLVLGPFPLASRPGDANKPKARGVHEVEGRKVGDDKRTREVGRWMTSPTLAHLVPILGASGGPGGNKMTLAGFSFALQENRPVPERDAPWTKNSPTRLDASPKLPTMTRRGLLISGAKKLSRASRLMEKHRAERVAFSVGLRGRRVHEDTPTRKAPFMRAARIPAPCQSYESSRLQFLNPFRQLVPGG